MHIKQIAYGYLAACLCLGLGLGVPARADEPLIVYSHRHYEADDRLFGMFTDRTGIPVHVVKAGADELMERLKAEGAKSKADVLITADAGRLSEAKRAGLLAPAQSEILTARIPAPYRDPEGCWFGFTLRARVFVYAPDRVDAADLSSYEDLAHPRWRGRLLCRSSANIYNQSLLASILAAQGREAALSWAAAVRRNLARPPQGSDRDQIRAVAAGLGDVAIVNTYYLGLLIDSPDAGDRAAGERVAIFFPNQNDRGTHVNVSGAGILQTSSRKDNALRLLEFLASDEAQAIFPLATKEYPVVEGIAWSDLQKTWGPFKADTLNLNVLGEQNRLAVQLFNLAGWE